MNVVNQGTLITDIASNLDTVLIEHKQEGKHPVRVLKGSLLSEIVGLDSGMVNTGTQVGRSGLLRSFMPACRGVRFALLELHSSQAVTMFSQQVGPPR